MMSRSRTLYQIVRFTILLINALFPLSISAKCCESDSDCASKTNAKYIREEYLQICSNGTCTCPPDYIGGSVYAEPIYCVSPIVNTTRSCSGNSDCKDGERCLQNSTCGSCRLGKFSSTSDTCEELQHGETCAFDINLEFKHSQVRLKFQKQCSGEELYCDVDGYETLGSNKCTCVNSHYYDLDLKKCTPRPEFGEDCSRSKLCKDDPSSYGYSKCGEKNICICAGTKNETGFCFQRPNGPCSTLSSPDSCTQHSSCVRDYYRSYCQCDPLYVDSREGECLPFIHGRWCESDPDLETLRAIDHQRLECVNEKYQCARLMEQYYDIGPAGKWHWSRWRHICVTQLGAPCTGIDDTLCTDGASCVHVDGQFICKCDEHKGYSVVPENKCAKHVGFGGECIKDCNHFAGMICKRGVCGCLDPTMEYDSRNRQCLSPEGHFCGTKEVGYDKVKIGCQRGLKCGGPKGAVHWSFRCIKDDCEKAPSELEISDISLI